MRHHNLSFHGENIKRVRAGVINNFIELEDVPSNLLNYGETKCIYYPGKIQSNSLKKLFYIIFIDLFLPFNPSLS